MKTKSIILTVMAMLLAGKTYPYSHDGHYLVGAIADQMLAGTPTSVKVKRLLGNVSLATAATMPDEIKDWDPHGRQFGSPFNVTNNKKLNSGLEAFLNANQTRPDCSGELLHHEYHFTDVQVFDPSTYSQGQVGTSGHDVVHMISFCIDVLSGRQSPNNPQKITQPVALVLLVHYVGDIHQPLHVGAEYFDQAGNPANPNHTTPFAADKGGNALAMELTNLPDRHAMHPGNLHHYWDQNAVETAMVSWAKQINSANPNPRPVTLNDVAKFLKNRLPQGWTAEPNIDPATFAVNCANEILPIAQEAHKRLSFSGIINNNGVSCLQVKGGNASASTNYPAFAAAVVADEIQKGGHRLADLLQKILK